MSFDRETGEVIARLMARIRTEHNLETWDLPGCIKAVGMVRNLEPANVAMAALRLAVTPEAQTPMALANRDGQHWRERIAASTPRYPPRTDQACPRHPGEWPENCRGCAGDKLAGDTSDASPKGATKAGERVQGLKELHRIATAQFCSHGVDPERCAEKHERAEEEDSQ